MSLTFLRTTFYTFTSFFLPLVYSPPLSAAPWLISVRRFCLYTFIGAGTSCVFFSYTMQVIGASSHSSLPASWLIWWLFPSQRIWDGISGWLLNVHVALVTPRLSQINQCSSLGCGASWDQLVQRDADERCFPPQSFRCFNRLDLVQSQVSPCSFSAPSWVSKVYCGYLP